MNIVLTNAGLQKIVNAEQTGTAPVVISQIAFGSGQYTANASQIALQNEIKRLPVISGGTDSSHSIHVAAQDASSDAYSVYEFGLFPFGRHFVCNLFADGNAHPAKDYFFGRAVRMRNRPARRERRKYFFRRRDFQLSVCHTRKCWHS